MIDTYEKAYVQILEIIKHMGEEYINKIPNTLLDFFEQNKDKNYIFKLNEPEELKGEVFSSKTLGLLAMIESKYWATPEEKEILDKALKENENKYQAQMRKKYNPDNIFKNKESKVEKVENTITLAEYKKSIFAKIKNWFKRTFFKVAKYKGRFNLPCSIL